MRIPHGALIGAIFSPIFFLLGFLTLFVTQVRDGKEIALMIGSALVVIGLVLLISGVVQVGVHRMLSQALTSPPFRHP